MNGPNPPSSSLSGSKDNPAREILSFLGGPVSKLFFEHLLRPLWEAYPNRLSDPVEALALFLRGYAFERTVGPQIYKSTSAETVMDLRTLNQPRLWEEYRSRLQRQDKKPNLRADPLYHCLSNCECVICVFGEDNIVRFVKEGLEAGNISAVHEKLQQVRGTGPKIASLFMRDVAVYFGLTEGLKTARDRYLLQPVDVWVKRTVKILAGDPTMKNIDVALWLVENAPEPERANQGIWYFCSQVVEPAVILQIVLHDPETARRLFDGYVSIL